MALQGLPRNLPQPSSSSRTPEPQNPRKQAYACEIAAVGQSDRKDGNGRSVLGTHGRLKGSSGPNAESADADADAKCVFTL
jgi:hypothetical protein